MKGRIGVPMQYKGFIIPRARYISRMTQGDITRGAVKRLAWIDYYAKAGNARLTCRLRGIPLYVLPPRRPDLNGCLERSNRTHTEEFYEVTELAFDLPTLNKELQAWETTYNTIRPHQALGYLTPLEYITEWKNKKEDVYGMY